MKSPLRETGCCPVCDRVVPRIVTDAPGVHREVYACPDHGAIGYGAQPISLKGWVDHLLKTSGQRATLAAFES